MGNSYSSDEKEGRLAGSFFVMLGCVIGSVVCPAAAPALFGGAMASTTYVVVDCATSTHDNPSKPGDFAKGISGHLTFNGKIGYGVSAGNDSGGIQPHITGAGTATEDMVRQREARSETKKVKVASDTAIIKKAVKVVENRYKGQYWKHAPTGITREELGEIQTLKLNSGTVLTKPALYMFEKDATLKCYKDDPEVERMYVIRRKLDGTPCQIGYLAHSGLLLCTKEGRWYVCEYGVEANPNKVSLYEVTTAMKGADGKPIKDVTSSAEVCFHARKWDKQICGSSLKTKASISSIKETMESRTTKHAYSTLFWNCHMAQEYVREVLTRDVHNKYFDTLRKMYKEEWYMEYM